MIKTPEMAESITEGTLKGWQVKEGDYVELDQEIGSIETDKIDVAINSPAAGTIKKFLANEEDTVQVGQDLIVLELGGEPGQSAQKSGSEPKEAADSSQTTSSDKGDAKQSEPQQEEAGAGRPKEKEQKEDAPSAPQQKSQEPSQPQPPKQQEHTSTPKQEPPKQSKPKQEESSSKTESPYGPREERRVKMNRMRLRIAERLKQSQNTAASLTTFNEVDMSNLMEMRKQYKDEILKKTGIKFGFMGAFVKASILAMRTVPTVNASIEGPGSGDTIVYKDYVDVSVAVATEKGLVTPVVRNAEALDMVGIESHIAELGKKVSQLVTIQACAPTNTRTGSRQQTHNRRHGRRHLHHLQWRRLRLFDGHTDHQPSADRCARPARHQGQAGGHQRQSRDSSDDVSGIDLRPQAAGWTRGEFMILMLMFGEANVSWQAVTFLVKIKEYIEDPRKMLIPV